MLPNNAKQASSFDARNLTVLLSFMPCDEACVDAFCVGPACVVVLANGSAGVAALGDRNEKISAARVASKFAW